MARIINKKRTIKYGVEYEYVSLDESISFICDKCLKPKIVKKYAIYVNNNGELKRICNSCYSNACQGK